jgi:hypothetical protein
MAFDGNEGEQISLERGAAYTKKHRDHNPGATKGIFYGRNHIEAILAQPDCMGLRMYFGEEADGSRVLVLAGADSAENDLTDIIVEVGARCPPGCSASNPLNSDLKSGVI